VGAEKNVWTLHRGQSVPSNIGRLLRAIRVPVSKSQLAKVQGYLSFSLFNRVLHSSQLFVVNVGLDRRYDEHQNRHDQRGSFHPVNWLLLSMSAPTPPSSWSHERPKESAQERWVFIGHGVLVSMLGFLLLSYSLTGFGYSILLDVCVGAIGIIAVVGGILGIIHACSPNASSILLRC
jgi:hypothetical protein